jgi:hypothetical protein
MLQRRRASRLVEQSAAAQAAEAASKGAAPARRARRGSIVEEQDPSGSSAASSSSSSSESESDSETRGARPAARGALSPASPRGGSTKQLGPRGGSTTQLGARRASNSLASSQIVRQRSVGLVRKQSSVARLDGGGGEDVAAPAGRRATRVLVAPVEVDRVAELDQVELWVQRLEAQVRELEFATTYCAGERRAPVELHWIGVRNFATGRQQHQQHHRQQQEQQPQPQQQTQAQPHEQPQAQSPVAAAPEPASSPAASLPAASWPTAPPVESPKGYSQRARHSVGSGGKAALSLAELAEAAAAATAANAKSPLLSYFVVVAGLGAVGSMVADELARAGVGQLGLLDCGEVAAECVASGLYSRSYVGQQKATALAAMLQAGFPGLLVTPLRKEVAPGGSSLDALVAAGGRSAPDLVLCCIGGLIARLAVSSWCVRTGTPLLDLGVKTSKLELTMRAHLPAGAPGSALQTCLRCDPSVVQDALAGSDGQNAAPPEAAPPPPQQPQPQPQARTQEPHAAGDDDAPRMSEPAAQASSKPAMLASTAAVLAGLMVQRAVRFLLLGTSSSERERYVTTYNVLRDTFEVAPPLGHVLADCSCRR